MTRKTLEVQYAKLENTIKDLYERVKKQDDLLRQSIDFINDLEFQLASARMFAVAVMIVTNTESAEFSREELNDISENKMVDFTGVYTETGELSGVKLELKEVSDEAKEVADSETDGERVRESSEGNVDPSTDTVQARDDGFIEQTEDKRQH